MALKLNFNDSSVLSGYLTQALPQVGLENKGFIVGSDGGLAYKLLSIDDFPRELKFHTMDDTRQVSDYLDALRKHLDYALGFADLRGFELVSAFDSSVGKSRFVVQPFDPSSSNIYTAAVGSTYVRDVEQLENFLRMLKDQKPQLDNAYANLVELAKKLRT